MNTLLSVKDLRVQFLTGNGPVLAVDGVSFDLQKGQTLGLVGESGSGKSVSSLAIMRLLADNTQVEGSILFNGENLLHKSERELEQIRGNRISMIFQEPMTSLNPVFSIEDQLGEAISLHQGGKKKDLQHKVADLLDLVGFATPHRRMKEYPHQLSGGMRQRVMIAMALACNPDILIADEPTTALDVTIQAQILALIRDLQEKLDTAVLMITHDLGVVAQVAHQVAVMYAGQIVEYANVEDLYNHPEHPYTRALLDTIPDIHQQQDQLHEIKGMVPNLLSVPVGCRFHPRCTEALEICATQCPPMVDHGNSSIRCWQLKHKGE